MAEYSSEKKVKQEANKLGKERVKPQNTVIEIPKAKNSVAEEEEEEDGILIKSGLVNTAAKKVEVEVPKAENPPVAPAPEIPVPITPVIEEVKPEPKPKEVEKLETAPPVIAADPIEAVEPKTAEPVAEDAKGLKVIGKIDLEAGKKPKPSPKKEETHKEVKQTPKPLEPKVEIVVEKEPEILTPQAEVEQPVLESASTDTPASEEDVKVMDVKYEKLDGLKVLGKIELKQDPPKKANPVASSDSSIDAKRKRKRKQIDQSGIQKVDPAKDFDPRNRPAGGGFNRGLGQGGNNQQGGNNRFNKGGNQNNRNTRPAEAKTEISDKEIQDKLKATLARLNPGSKNPNIGQVRSKIRKQKRSDKASEREEQML